MIKFEWDDDKARANQRKHGISFEEATQAFRDTLAVVEIDDSEDYGEERLILIGMADNGLLMVVHTDRSYDEETQRIRLISARRATKHEEDHYYRENG